LNGFSGIFDRRPCERLSGLVVLRNLQQLASCSNDIMPEEFAQVYTTNPLRAIAIAIA